MFYRNKSLYFVFSFVSISLVSLPNMAFSTSEILREGIPDYTIYKNPYNADWPVEIEETESGNNIDPQSYDRGTERDTDNKQDTVIVIENKPDNNDTPGNTPDDNAGDVKPSTEVVVDTKPDDNNTPSNTPDDTNDTADNNKGDVSPAQSEQIDDSKLNQTANLGHAGLSSAMKSSSQYSTQIVDLALGNAQNIENGITSFSFSSFGKSKTSSKTIRSNISELNASYTEPTNFASSAQELDTSTILQLSSSSKNVVGKTNENDTESLSFTSGLRYQDANPWSSRKSDKAVLGAFINYSKLDADIGSNATLKADGIDQTGNVSLDKWGGGVFTLLTFHRTYVFGLTAASWGDVEATNKVLNSKSAYDVTDVSVNVGLGRVVDLGSSGKNKADLRLQLNYAYAESDSYLDTQSNSYGSASGNQLSTSLSVKFFSNYQYQDWLVRPFVQVGGNFTFIDEVDLSINGVDYTISDNNKASAISRLGIGISNKKLQGYVAAEGEWGDDIENYSLGLGLTLKLN